VPSRTEGMATVMSLPNDAKAIMFQEKKMMSKPEKDLIQNLAGYIIKFACIFILTPLYKIIGQGESTRLPQL
jgi:hypothetical protein